MNSTSYIIVKNSSFENTTKVVLSKYKSDNECWWVSYDVNQAQKFQSKTFGEAIVRNLNKISKGENQASLIPVG